MLFLMDFSLNFSMDYIAWVASNIDIYLSVSIDAWYADKMS